MFIKRWINYIERSIDFINLPVESASSQVIDHGTHPLQLSLRHASRVLELEDRATADQLADAALDRLPGRDGGFEVDHAHLQLFQRVGRVEVEDMGQGRHELRGFT